MYLRHHYGAFIADVLAIEPCARADQWGGEAPPAIHARLDRTLGQAEASARADGKDEAAVKAASTAVLGWADAHLLACGIRLETHSTLQNRHFGEQNAGDDFFTHIADLAEDDQDQRDFHYLILSLGYTGRFARSRANPAELEAIRTGLRASLADKPINPKELDRRHLTPQPYEMPAPAPRPAPPSRRWLAIPAVLALLLPLAALWVPADSAPAIALRDDPRPRLEALTRGFECASLSVEAAPGDNPAVWLRGHMRSAEDRDRLLRDASLLPGIGRLDSAIEVQPWPFCAFIQVLAPLETETRRRLPMQLGLEGGVAQWPMPSIVELRMGMPPLSGHLTLVYVNSQGDVLNLYPNAARPSMPLPVNAQPSLADLLPPRAQLHVLPPAGIEMVFMVHTPTPLFPAPRPAAEPPETLLAALRDALARQQAAGAGPLARFLLFTTFAADGASPSGKGRP